MKFLTLGLWIVISIPSLAQDNSTGVFMTMKGTRNSSDFSKAISTRDNTKKNTVVVPLKPIISSDEFTKVSEIIDDARHNTTYFYLSFSNEGIAKLRDITTKVEGVQLVLVVNDTVIGYIKTMSEIVNRAIQINGPTNSPDVLWAHKNLEKIIDSKVKN